MPENRIGELDEEKANDCRLLGCQLFYDGKNPTCAVKQMIESYRKSRKNRQIVVSMYASQIPDENCPEEYK